MRDSQCYTYPLLMGIELSLLFIIADYFCSKIINAKNESVKKIKIFVILF